MNKTITPVATGNYVNSRRHSESGQSRPSFEQLVESAPRTTFRSEAEQLSGVAVSPNMDISDFTEDAAEFPPSRKVLTVDPLRAADALWRRGKAIIGTGLVIGVLAATGAYLTLHPHYVATSQLVKQTMPDTFRASQAGEPFKPHDISIPVLTTSLMRNGTLLDRVSAKTSPKLAPLTILNSMALGAERSADVVRVTFTSDASPKEAASIANIYADELLNLTKEIQEQEATEVNDYLRQQLARCESDLAKVSDELLQYSKTAKLPNPDKDLDSQFAELGGLEGKYENTRLECEAIDMKIRTIDDELAKVSPVADKLQKAKENLTELLYRYKDNSPLVMDQRARIASLESELKNQDLREAKPPQPGSSPIAESLYLRRVDLTSQKTLLSQQLKKLDDMRGSFNYKLGQLPRQVLEYGLIKAKRQSLETTRQMLSSRQREAELFMGGTLGYYRLLTSARLEDVVTDRRLWTILLVGLSGLLAGCLVFAVRVVITEYRDHKIKTSTDLQRVTGLPVLGILQEGGDDSTASQDRWAFRAWSQLQPHLKRSNGAVVFGMIAEDSAESCSLVSRLLAKAASRRGVPVLIVSSQPTSTVPCFKVSDYDGFALKSVVDRWLAESTGVAILQVDEIWTWSPEQRALFEASLNQWSRHRSAVILVELPSASKLETLFVAEQLPQLLWVGQSGEKSDGTLSETLATYRDSGCRFLGSMLIRAPRLRPAFLGRLMRASTAVGLFMIFTLGASADARAESTARTLSNKTAVAAPQKKSDARSLKLGPGDSVNLTMFAYPETARTDIRIGPDGRISYLQAQSVVAAGLTMDELRTRLETELSATYQDPRVVIMPADFQSHKIYLLGKVVKKGIVNYDRPLTLLEAVAEAGGLETGAYQQNTVELADLSRSFLSRNGKRVKVDFEALFYRGDMSQNVSLEAEDYLYFPSANANEIYVLGNVKAQGAQGLFSQTTVTSALALAGGFTPKAFKSRVLVVRGSLSKPQSFVVNMKDVLAGREKGFRLEPKDIVFVADKPWARAEELLDMALRSFIQGAVTGYTTLNVGPFIR